MEAGKKILIIHFRVGKTDGVSLEIGAWKEILEKAGAKVFLCAGSESAGADMVVDHFEYQLDPEIYALDQETFGGFKNMTEEEYERRYTAMGFLLVNEFNRVMDTIKPDRVIVSNVFSVGVNIPAAAALAGVLIAKNIPTVAVHHDFYWESIRYKKPSSKIIEQRLGKILPPIADNIRHACINSIARDELKSRCGLNAEIVYDTLDFERPAGDHNGVCRELLRKNGVKDDDLMVLQATRIVRRKNIELSIDFVRELGFLTKRRVVLVLAGYAEKKSRVYQEQLREYAGQSGVVMIELNGLASNFVKDSGEKCDLLGIYPHAEIITYPSEYEGFGNQFLETVYAKKPIIIWEYPVFKSDIKPLGFEVISLGDKLLKDGKAGLAKVEPEVMRKAAEEALDVINNEAKRKEITEKNFTIAKENFSYDRTEQFWEQQLTLS
jgi:glycosyltransferase involved in cell wall biosynthesis